MSLAHGRPYLAIPGPSVMPDAVLRAMHRASPNIYEGAIVEMVAGLIPDLRYVAQTAAAKVAIYIANGHGAWEAALVNVVGEGDKVLVPATGRFAHGWAEMARGLGAEVELIEFGTKSTYDPALVAEALRNDKDRKIKAVLASHVDTATSIRNDLASLRAAMDSTGHPALLMADCVASLGVEEFRMDDWGVDIMVTGSQKGLMVPPGLGFVFFNEKAEARRAEMTRVSRYWDWVPRGKPDFFYEYFGGTAPTHHLYGLRAALDMIREEGIEQIWHRHAVLARTIWAAAEAWGQGGPLTLNVADRGLRSHAVTALRLGAPYGAQLRKWCETEAGVTLGIGLGMAEPDDPMGTGFFRIGHMGHVNTHMILGLLGVLEAGFLSLGIPHGQGALSAAAAEIAKG